MNPLKFIFAIALVLSLGFVLFSIPVIAFAADAVLDVPVDQFLIQVFEMIKTFGGLSWQLKIAAIITLIVASMKVSFLRQLIWDKLGWAKVIVAPGLAIVGGVITLSVEGHLTFAGVVAYLFAGAGALILHELLDGIKGFPGLGKLYVGIIEFLMKLLGAKAAAAQKA